MNPENLLSQELKLPNGTVIKNRFAKSAMSETLATTSNKPTEKLCTLYKKWAEGGTGLLITGHVMIDSKAPAEPNNVVIENEKNLDELKSWAAAGTINDTKLFMQINHPGKQIPAMMSKDPVAPSAVPFSKKLARMFKTPRALTEEEIWDLISRYGKTSEVAKKTGFSGVQIHGAHGYLVSQFNSPHHNQRKDQWGGSLENRTRFVSEVYKAIREKVGNDFPISIKLNSADFQRGGFSEGESMETAQILSDLGMDLIEISGGTFETPEMTGGTSRKSTIEREAYFLEYAEKIREKIKTPLMVTGGFRTSKYMENAIEENATDLVGLARPLAIEPDLCNRIIAGEYFKSKVSPILTGIKYVDEAAMMETTWYARQITRMANGKNPKPDENAIWSLLAWFSTMAVRGFRSQRMRANE